MRIVSFCILIFLICSCKKNFTCACKTTVIYAGGSEVFNSSVGSFERRFTKKQAKAVCDREATAIDQTYNNAISNNGSWSTNGVYAKSSCVVK